MYLSLLIIKYPLQYTDFTSSFINLITVQFLQKIYKGNRSINILTLERDHWGDPDVDGRIILRWIFRKWEGVVGTGWSWLRIGTGGGHL